MYIYNNQHERKPKLTMQADELLRKTKNLHDAKHMYLCRGEAVRYHDAVNTLSWVLRQYVCSCIEDVEQERRSLTPQLYTELQVLIKAGRDLLLNAVMTEEDLDLRLMRILH